MYICAKSIYVHIHTYIHISLYIYIYIYMAVCQNRSLVHDLVQCHCSAHKGTTGLCKERSRTSLRTRCTRTRYAQGAHKVGTRYAQGYAQGRTKPCANAVCAQRYDSLVQGGWAHRVRTRRAQGVQWQ